MFDLRNILNLKPYSLKKSEKNALYDEAINYLTNYHYGNCLQYKKILDLFGFNPKLYISLNRFPKNILTLRGNCGYFYEYNI